jgi:hypothetical protein
MIRCITSSGENFLMSPESNAAAREASLIRSSRSSVFLFRTPFTRPPVLAWTCEQPLVPSKSGSKSSLSVFFLTPGASERGFTPSRGACSLARPLRQNVIVGRIAMEIADLVDVLFVVASTADETAFPGRK